MVLRVDHISKRFRHTPVVKDVSLEVREGEIVGLLGPNGAGKTTIFYMIIGAIRPDKGRIMINGDEITHLPIHIRARRGIGYLSQEPSIFNGLTVEENILAILQTLNLSKEEMRSRTSSLLNELGISHLSSQKAYTLSGGERRRCEIARCLVRTPSFILLDEPFLGVDPITVEEIQRMVIRLKEKEIGILITDHRVREILDVTDRSYILVGGEILSSGSPSDLVSDPNVRSLYLGEGFEETLDNRPEL
jgi:lipopolysaccharide export system ATP-binding protein